MRRLLWLSPYFPPQTRVGALRPLKFVRHLRAHGWESVVLADLQPGDALDDELADAVPRDVHVVRNWSAAAQPCERRWLARRAQPGRAPRAPRPTAAEATREAGELDAKRELPPWRRLNPEWLPLGEHLRHLPHALRAGRTVLAHFPASAIIVNADPWAAAWVGARLAAEHRLPLIVDLRDPWALCELRRPLRPLPQRLLNDRLERHVIEQASAVILNTEATLGDYRAWYRDLPADRFACIRNHGDGALVAGGQHPGFDRYTLLFLGNFGRFIKADVLIRVLAELAARGVGPDRLQLVVTGAFPAESWRMARGMGADRYIHLHPHVPYREIGGVMAAADLLVLLVQPRGRQRIAAKFFDYLVAERPLLAISESEELAGLLRDSGAGSIHPYADVPGIADAIVAALAEGRGQSRPRRPIGATSAEAAADLAAILERVCGPAALG